MSRIQSRTSLQKLCISCTLCVNHSPLSYPLLLCSPTLPFSSSVIVFLPSLLPVSGSWQLVSITVIPQALSCVRLMVHQQVKQQHRSSPTKHSYHRAPSTFPVHIFVMSASVAGMENIFSYIFSIFIYTGPSNDSSSRSHLDKYLMYKTTNKIWG